MVIRRGSLVLCTLFFVLCTWFLVLGSRLLRISSTHDLKGTSSPLHSSFGQRFLPIRDQLEHWGGAASGNHTHKKALSIGRDVIQLWIRRSGNIEKRGGFTHGKCGTCPIHIY